VRERGIVRNERLALGLADDHEVAAGGMPSLERGWRDAFVGERLKCLTLEKNIAVFRIFLAQVSGRTCLNFQQLFDQATPYLGPLRSGLGDGLRIEPFVPVGTETIRLIPSTSMVMRAAI
jgi:hypothetical protein